MPSSAPAKPAVWRFGEKENQIRLANFTTGMTRKTRRSCGDKRAFIAEMPQFGRELPVPSRAVLTSKNKPTARRIDPIARVAPAVIATPRGRFLFCTEGKVELH